MNDGGQSISGSGFLRNTSLFPVNIISPEIRVPSFITNAVSSYQLGASSNKTLKNTLCSLSSHLKIHWDLFHNRWYIFNSLQILAFLFATSLDLADEYRSFGGTAMEESVCQRNVFNDTSLCSLSGGYV